MMLKSSSPACEFGNVALDLKAVSEQGEVEGYASLFGEMDQGRDIVLAGAFSESLKSRGPGRVRMLFQHDPREPIGVWSELVVDGKGLRA